MALGTCINRRLWTCGAGNCDAGGRNYTHGVSQGLGAKRQACAAGIKGGRAKQGVPGDISPGAGGSGAKGPGRGLRGLVFVRVVIVDSFGQDVLLVDNLPVVRLSLMQ